MFEKAKLIIYNLPIEEVKEYYCYMTDNCNCDDKGYRDHIYNKLKQCCRWHRYKGILNIETTFKAFNIFCWLNYENKKYNIIKKDIVYKIREMI